MIRLDVVLLDDLRDFLIGESPGILGALSFLSGRALTRNGSATYSAWGCATSEHAARLPTSGIGKLERAAVESETEIYFLCRDFVAPQKIKGALDLGQVCVCEDLRANGVGAVPNSVEAAAISAVS